MRTMHANYGIPALQFMLIYMHDRLHSNNIQHCFQVRLSRFYLVYGYRFIYILYIQFLRIIYIYVYILYVSKSYKTNIDS